jgi:hypothetical protein
LIRKHYLTTNKVRKTKMYKIINELDWKGFEMNLSVQNLQFEEGATFFYRKTGDLEWKNNIL